MIVTVTVAPLVLSTDMGVGETAIVDTVAEAAPTVKVVVAVLDRATPSVVLLAEIVLVATSVDFITAVVCPLASVGAIG